MRAREHGILLPGLSPGPLNAITDVAGVAVGHATLVEGENIRTGVTAVLPHPGNLYLNKVPAAVHVVNGFGKAAGLSQVQELGELETPIILTNTLSVGAALDALVEYKLERNPEIGRSLPTVNGVVAECNDGFLNDIRARRVGAREVRAALTAAGSGPVPEGNVGAGTGMSAFSCKAGIGTSSRLAGEYTCGVLVLSNFGRWHQLKIAGVPVGQLLPSPAGDYPPEKGSIVMVAATDAPLDSRQLSRLAKRAAFGLARTGSVAGHGSGDYVLAFSTGASSLPLAKDRQVQVGFVDSHLDRLFEAVVEATEEAILNALFAAETMWGRDGNVRYSLPVAEVLRVMSEYRSLDLKEE